MKNIHITSRYRKIIKATISIIFLLSLLLNILLIYKGQYISKITNYIKCEKEYSSLLSTYTTNEIYLDNNDKINYVCIGNSITLHSQCDYWWEERGIASTSINTDYVHLLSSLFSTDFSTVSYNAINFSDWEKSSWDRAETLPQLNSYLNTDIDLVIIQLGENATDTSTLEEDFHELITYCADKTNGHPLLYLANFGKTRQKIFLKSTPARKLVQHL